MATPRFLSPAPDDVDLSAVRVGAQMLGLPLLPQGETISRVLEAKDADGFPLYPQVGLLVPRRAAKTTTCWAVTLGRCATIPGYRAVVTAQDGTRARQRFREVARSLEAAGFEDGVGTIRWANGSERLEFANESHLWVVPPSAGAFRGEAADLMFFDEAGELDPVHSEDLLTGALPLMDTRPQGQVIVAGTPAKVRAGLLWDTLDEGRRGEPGAGVVEYSIADDEATVLYPEGPEGPAVLNEDALRRVHPGVGTLTTMAKMQQRFAKMDLPSFEREYFCRFPFDATVSALDPLKWANAEVAPLPRPERFGVAWDVAPDGSAAAVCVGWRDDDGTAFLGVLEYRSGVSWLAGYVHGLCQRHRGLSVRFDAIGANHGPSAEMARMKGIALVPGTWREAQAAAQRLADDLKAGRLRHFGQSSLTVAAEGAVWRQTDGGQMFGRKSSASDVSPLVAASLALWQFDSTPKRQPVRITSSHRAA